MLSGLHTFYSIFSRAGVCTGDEICALSPPVGPNGAIPSTPASIILIDRQLDIMTPALHHAHVLDRIFGQLRARSNSSKGSKGSSVHAQVAPLVQQQAQEPVPEGSSPTKRPRQADAETTVEDAGEDAAQGATEAVGEGLSDEEDDRDQTATVRQEAVQTSDYQHQQPVSSKPYVQSCGLR